jgi:hypothetical protein
VEGLITRPHLPRLGLDLVEPESHAGRNIFEGRTTDGRPFAIKYRTGWLQIWLDQKDEAVIEARIGPRYHSSILFEQVCDLTGMTIDGRPPVISPARLEEMEEDGDYLDWSGATTYWERWFTASRRGASRLAEAILHAFPTAMPMEFQVQGQSCRVKRLGTVAEFSGVTFGIGGDASNLDRLLTSWNVRQTDLQQSFDHIIDLRVDAYTNPSAEEISRGVGQPIELAKTLNGSIRTSIRSGNDRDLDFLNGLAGIAEGCFFSNIDNIDIKKRAILEEHRSHWWSVDLADWCRGSPDRYLSAWRNPRDQTYVGIRPSASSPHGHSSD